jgi:hypothetical protein
MLNEGNGVVVDNVKDMRFDIDVDSGMDLMNSIERIINE